MSRINDTIFAMMDYFKGDPARIQHFMSVYAFARAIGVKENLPDDVQYLVEVAAITHNIGVKNSEAKYGSAAGEYLEIEGPPEAEKMLREIGYDEEFIDKICFLIANRNHYKNYDNAPYQILAEANLLVNISQEKINMELANNLKEKIFKTKTGLKMFEDLYNV